MLFYCLIGVYILISLGVGAMASDEGKSFVGWFITSLCLTPLIAMLLMEAWGGDTNKKKGDDLPKLSPNVNIVTGEDGKPVAAEIVKIRELCKKEKFKEAQQYCVAYLHKIADNPHLGLSEKDYNDILSTAKNINVVLDDSAMTILNNAYGLMTLETRGKIFRPKMGDVSINLRKNEIVYFRDCRAWLRKWKTVSEGRTYSGFSFSVPIAKGLRYRVGSFNPPEKQRYLGAQDGGNFLITNKRVIFSGINANFSIPLNKILKMGVNEHGLCIQRENTLEPKILTMKDYDIPLYVLSALINEEPIHFMDEETGAKN